MNTANTLFLMALVLLAPHLSEFHAKCWALGLLALAIVSVLIDFWRDR